MEGDEACVPYLAVLKHAFHIWQVLKHAADVVKTRTIPPEVIAYWLDTIATPLSSYYTKPSPAPPTILSLLLYYTIAPRSVSVQPDVCARSKWVAVPARECSMFRDVRDPESKKEACRLQSHSGSARRINPSAQDPSLTLTLTLSLTISGGE